jgi:hypothetical protein
MLKNQRGSGLLLVIMIFAVLFALVGISLERSGDVLVNVQKHHLETAALNLAEAGVEYTIHQIVHTEQEIYGETSMTLEPVGSFSVTVSRVTPSNKVEILSVGKARGSGPFPEVVKTLKVVVQLSPEDTEQPLHILSRQDVS